MPRKPLEGIKILDFTWAMAGPIAVKTFSDYGAEVIRLEGKNIRPDTMRALGPHRDDIAGLNRSSGFNNVNTSKMSVSINLSKPRAKELVKKFAVWADVVVENMVGGAMKKMGIGYDELKKVNPGIIMLSACIMGQTGPHSHLRGFGGPLTALSGFDNITGYPDRKPDDLQQYTDYIAPHFAVTAIIAALDYRRRTGKGQYLDLSQYEAGVHFMAPLVLDYAVNKRIGSRMGNRLQYAVPHSAYRCQGEDRWCTIAVFNDEEWQAFCEVIGKPGWTKSPNFGSLLSRKANEDELDRLVEAWTIQHSAEEIMLTMQKAGVAAGVLNTAEDLVLHDPQLKHRQLYQKLDHPEVGKYIAPRPVFILSKSPCEVKRAPLIGEHNDYCLKELLGLSDDEIAEFVIEEVIE